MPYCPNPQCIHPENPPSGKFCVHCGSKLTLCDRYLLLQPLSQNNQGRTFLGIEAANRRKCVIKQVLTSNLESIAKFKQEVTQLQLLGQHPQIPTVLATFPGDYQLPPTLVLEFIEGKNLKQTLIWEGVFKEDKIKEFLDQILPILAFVHQEGVIHRDLNPDNLIYSNNNQLFLVDFSAAKTTSKTALAKTGTLIGSVAYTAPEQLRGKAIIASDIYSLGMICVHLMTLIEPFDLFSSSQGLVWKDYLTHPVSKAFQGIIDKMVADQVRDRYQSVIEIWQDLHPGKTLDIPSFQPISTITPTPASPHWQCITTLKEHHSSVHSLAVSRDGKLLASGGADQRLIIWNLESKQVKLTLNGHRGIIDAVIFTPDDNQVISSSWDHTIRIWELETGEESGRLEGHSGWIHCLAITPDGKTLVSGGADQKLKIWDLMTKQLKNSLDAGLGVVTSLAISPDGRVLAAGGANKVIKLFKIEQNQELFSLEGHQGNITSLAFTPGGQILISASADHSVKIWQWTHKQVRFTLEGHSDAVNSVFINSEGNLLVSGGSDRALNLWHPSSGKLSETLFEHQSGIKAVTITPDSSMIISAAQDKTIKLWQYR